MCWMTIRLKKEYFDSEETLKSASASLSSQGQFLQQNIASMRRYLRKKFIRVESTHFFGWRQKLWTLRNLFSTEGCLHNSNDNVVSYHMDSVAALLDLEDKRRPENIAFPFLAKSLPGYRDAHQIISIILWQSTLLVGEEHILIIFFTKTPASKLDDEEKSTSAGKRWRRRHLNEETEHEYEERWRFVPPKMCLIMMAVSSIIVKYVFVKIVKSTYCRQLYLLLNIEEST